MARNKRYFSDTFRTPYRPNQIFPGHAFSFRSRVIIRATTYQNFSKIVGAVFEKIAKNLEKRPFSALPGQGRFWPFSDSRNF